MIKRIPLYLFCSLLFLLSCDGNRTDKTLVFVPGEDRSVSVSIEDVWGKRGSKGAKKKIEKYLQDAPEGFKLKERGSVLDIDWNPPEPLSGEVFALGAYHLEVAIVEPIKTTIVGNKISLIDDGCFSYADTNKRKLELTQLKGKRINLKKIRVFKVKSVLNDQRRLISKDIERFSCIFTANFELNTYSVKLPESKNKGLTQITKSYPL